MAEGFVCRFRAICCECSAVGFKVEVSKPLDEVVQGLGRFI